MDTLINPYRRTALRSGLIDWMDREHFTHAITLNPNRDELSMSSLSNLFKRFCHQIDRLKLDRCRVHLTPTSERFEAIAMPEKLVSKAHLHLVADLRFMLDWNFDEKEIWSRVYVAWAKATRGCGTVDVQRHYGREWPWYITKEALAANHVYFLASDFHPL